MVFCLAGAALKGRLEGETIDIPLTYANYLALLTT